MSHVITPPSTPMAAPPPRLGVRALSMNLARPIFYRIECADVGRDGAIA
jgi:hypothetical protein